MTQTTLNLGEVPAASKSPITHGLFFWICIWNRSYPRYLNGLMDIRPAERTLNCSIGHKGSTYHFLKIRTSRLQIEQFEGEKKKKKQLTRNIYKFIVSWWTIEPLNPSDIWYIIRHWCVYRVQYWNWYHSGSDLFSGIGGDAGKWGSGEVGLEEWNS